MPERILVIVSCSLMYFQYPDGTVSRPYVGNFCSDEAGMAEVLRRRHRRAWKQAMAARTTPGATRPLPPPTRPAPSWAYDFGTRRRGWK